MKIQKKNWGGGGGRGEGSGWKGQDVKIQKKKFFFFGGGGSGGVWLGVVPGPFGLPVL